MVPDAQAVDPAAPAADALYVPPPLALGTLAARALLPPGPARRLAMPVQPEEMRSRAARPRSAPGLPLLSPAEIARRLAAQPANPFAAAAGLATGQGCAAEVALAAGATPSQLLHALLENLARIDRALTQAVAAPFALRASAVTAAAQAPVHQVHPLSAALRQLDAAAQG